MAGIIRSKRMLDVRAVANLVLDFADNHRVQLTNMALNKVVYFIHCDHLVELGEPLVGAKIEAWQHGPVFREVYHEFKNWGDRSIESRARRVNADSGNVEVAVLHVNNDKLSFINELISRYAFFSAAHLRAMSHREGGPWDRVWSHDGKTNPGMRISTELILVHYIPGERQ